MSQSSRSPVLLTVHDGVATITLNRPAVGNTIDMDCALAFERAIDAALDDPAVRAIVLTGQGRLFCAGGDIAAFAAAGADAGTFLFDLASALHRGVRKLAEAEKPLITAVHGPAAGAGMSLALLGDIALAGRSAHFTAAYPGVGLTPDGGMSWLLPRLVGLRRAQEILLSNRRVSAEEAAALGMVTRVVEDADLLAEAQALATAIAQGAAQALGGARRLLADSYQASLGDQLDREAARIAQAGSGPEAGEGIAAFLARRKPDFTTIARD